MLIRAALACHLSQQENLSPVRDVQIKEHALQER